MTETNYYEILQVFPGSSQHEIKKAFRRLVHRYHPDKNPADEQTLAHLRNIQQAYETLSNPSKKELYDLSNGVHLRSAFTFTPAILMERTAKLRRYLVSLSPHFIDQQGLVLYINKLLSDEHLRLLRNEDHQPLNRQIVKDMLDAGNYLDYSKLPALVNKLNVFASYDPASEKMISSYVLRRKRNYLWNRYRPFVVLLATIAFCYLMYVYAE